MPKYVFTGEVDEVFAGVVVTDEHGGTSALTCSPGDVVDLPEDVYYAHLVPEGGVPAPVTPAPVVADVPAEVPSQTPEVFTVDEAIAADPAPVAPEPPAEAPPVEPTPETVPAPDAAI